MSMKPDLQHLAANGSDSLHSISRYLADLSGVLDAMPRAPLAEIVERVLRAAREGRTILILGNGGSAATASHLACDLAKTAAVPGFPRIRALALTDNVPLLTAWGNDVSYDVVFAEQIRTYSMPGDVVIAISASGNSPNVLAAVAAAREIGTQVIGLAGFGGGYLAPLCDVCLVVPSSAYGPVEDAHMIVVHAVTSAIRSALASHALVPMGVAGAPPG